MNRKLLFFICLTGIVSLLMAGCHTRKHEKNGAEFSEEENYELQPEGDLDDGYNAEYFDRIRNGINKLLPVASVEDKEELNNILKYLDEIQKQDPVFFEDPHNNIKFVKTLVRLSLMSAKLFPEDFHTNMIVSIMYARASQTLEQHEITEESKRLIEDYRKKGIQEAKDLVERFPDNGMSYGNLAWFHQMVIGDDEKALELYKRCLDIDPESEYCRNGYDIMREELKK